MNITYKTTKENINWEEVAEVLRKSHLSDHSAKEQQTKKAEKTIEKTKENAIEQQKNNSRGRKKK